MLQSDQTDEELMISYQKGSEEAFRALYDRHSGKIFGYLKSRVGSKEVANDLFQEVFVKIHRSKHLYNSSLPALPWIFSVTHSTLIDGLRKAARKREVHEFDFDRLPTAETEQENRLGSVTSMVTKLPESQKTALQMRYIDEKTFEEIAVRLKTSPLNVRQIISRGVRQLRSLVKEGEKP